MQEDQFIQVTEDLEQRIRELLDEEEFSPELMNLVRLGTAVHEVAFHCPKVSKDALLKFVEGCFEGGEHQRKVNNMEIEGGIMNSIGVTQNIACFLAMQGEPEGLLIAD